MNVQIRAKDITLHANTKAHIESAIDGFSKYGLDITTVNVNVKAEKKVFQLSSIFISLTLHLLLLIKAMII